MAAGRSHFLPAAEQPEFEFTLAGRPGDESVVAIATADPLTVPLAPDGDDPFRTLSPDGVAAVVDAVLRTNPRRWAVAVCRFRIVEC